MPAGGGLLFGLEGQALALGGRDMVQICQLFRGVGIQLRMLRITLGCGLCKNNTTHRNAGTELSNSTKITFYGLELFLELFAGVLGVASSGRDGGAALGNGVHPFG